MGANRWLVTGVFEDDVGSLCSVMACSGALLPTLKHHRYNTLPHLFSFLFRLAVYTTQKRHKVIAMICTEFYVQDTVGETVPFDSKRYQQGQT